MAQQLPGEKRICFLGLRVEETEYKKLYQQADEERISASQIVRRAIRKELELEDPTDEYLPPHRERKG
jgi:hypothetical protein